MTTEDSMKAWWPVISMVVNIGLGVMAALLVRYVAALLQQVKQEIQLAIATLKVELMSQYATKADLTREVDVVNRLERGFNNVYRLIIEKQKSEGLVSR